MNEGTIVIGSSEARKVFNECVLCGLADDEVDEDEALIADIFELNCSYFCEGCVAATQELPFLFVESRIDSGAGSRFFQTVCMRKFVTFH